MAAAVIRGNGNHYFLTCIAIERGRSPHETVTLPAFLRESLAYHFVTRSIAQKPRSLRDFPLRGSSRSASEFLPLPPAPSRATVQFVAFVVPSNSQKKHGTDSFLLFPLLILIDDKLGEMVAGRDGSRGEISGARGSVCGNGFGVSRV